MSAKWPNVSSSYGAPMGRRDYLNADADMPVRFRLYRSRWVDGDYDEGGAYWGAGGGGSIYRAEGEDDEGTELYVRATSREDAKTKVRLKYPNARFYR